MALLSLLSILGALAAPGAAAAPSASSLPVLDPEAPQHEPPQVVQVEEAKKAQQLAWARTHVDPDTKPSQLGKRFTLSPSKPWIDGRGKLWFVSPWRVDPELNSVEVIHVGQGDPKAWISGRFVVTTDFTYLVDCVVESLLESPLKKMSVRVDWIASNGADPRKLWRDKNVHLDGKHLIFAVRPKKAGKAIFSFWSPDFSYWRFHRCEITPVAK